MSFSNLFNFEIFFLLLKMISYNVVKVFLGILHSSYSFQLFFICSHNMFKIFLYKYNKKFQKKKNHVNTCKINHWLVLKWLVSLYSHPKVIFLRNVAFNENCMKLTSTRAKLPKDNMITFVHLPRSKSTVIIETLQVNQHL